MDKTDRNIKKNQNLHFHELYILAIFSLLGLIAMTTLYFIHKEVPESLTILTTASITAIAAKFKGQDNEN